MLLNLSISLESGTIGGPAITQFLCIPQTCLAQRYKVSRARQSSPGLAGAFLPMHRRLCRDESNQSTVPRNGYSQLYHGVNFSLCYRSPPTILSQPASYHTTELVRFYQCPALMPIS
ncbi:hypothetical protein BDW75DRAFT_196668 [Aspergillus navahoensis]